MRTGTPPCSRITSGTACEQMRLCTTVSPGMAVEDARRDDRGGRRAAHRLAVVVDEEHAIGVAVEREPDVGAEVERPRAAGP